VVAGLEKGEINERDGGLTAGSDESAIAIFEFADACREFERGGRAIETIGVADGMLVPGVLDRGGIGKRTVDPRCVAGASDSKPSGAWTSDG